MAQAALTGKRVVIATYTNVLAEQYWNKEVPIVQQLLSDCGMAAIPTAWLMGRQRYACLTQVGEFDQPLRQRLLKDATVGHETEFRRLVGKGGLPSLWSRSAVPVVCPARLCPDYQACFYYSSRRQAAKAKVVITNHSVVIQDALMKAAERSEGLLGEYDFLILDEAHDFHLAASSGLEFELNPSKIQTFLNIGLQLGKLLQPLADSNDIGPTWKRTVSDFEQGAIACQGELARLGNRLSQPGIVASSPESLTENKLVQANRADINPEDVETVARLVEVCCQNLLQATDATLADAGGSPGQNVAALRDTIQNYRTYLEEFSVSIHGLLQPQGISVTHASKLASGARVRLDTIGLAEPLNRLIWAHVPTAFVSATIAIDGTFDYFRSTIGCESAFEEILKSPFEYSEQAALYIPPKGTIPDPADVRRSGNEASYYRAIAQELGQIISTCGGRTLALFHSRKEMEAVAQLVSGAVDLPILVQGNQGITEVGERFKNDVSSSLFALRSFWTGYDAPGQTLSCVAMVRIPFEVPVEPSQIARAAYLQAEGLNPFAARTLPLAKMLVRQGAGRLIRTSEDRGVIAILDPRIQTKPYGAEFIENLPQGLRSYSNFEEAAGAVQLI
jgi:Rad3-related DNA helicase